jgi:hypothetical protein
MDRHEITGAVNTNSGIVYVRSKIQAQLAKLSIIATTTLSRQ